MGYDQPFMTSRVSERQTGGSWARGGGSMCLNVISPTWAKLGKRSLHLSFASSSSTGALHPSNTTFSFLSYFSTKFSARTANTSSILLQYLFEGLSKLTLAFCARNVTVVKCGESTVGRTATISGLGLLACMLSNAISRSFSHDSRE